MRFAINHSFRSTGTHIVHQLVIAPLFEHGRNRAIIKKDFPEGHSPILPFRHQNLAQDRTRTVAKRHVARAKADEAQESRRKLLPKNQALPLPAHPSPHIDELQTRPRTMSAKEAQQRITNILQKIFGDNNVCQEWAVWTEASDAFMSGFWRSSMNLGFFQRTF